MDNGTLTWKEYHEQRIDLIFVYRKFGYLKITQYYLEPINDFRKCPLLTSVLEEDARKPEN